LNSQISSEAIAHQCAGLLPDRLPDATVREIVGAMAQSIEKFQLLRGGPIKISENRTEQFETARKSYVLAALPELARNHPDWSEKELQTAATTSFDSWFNSLNLNPVVGDTVQ